MEARCASTVRGLRKSSLATWTLVIPVATSPSTSTSRGVSPAGWSDRGVVSCSVSAAEEAMVESFSSERAYSTASCSSMALPSASAASHLSFSSDGARQPLQALCGDQLVAQFLGQPQVFFVPCLSLLLVSSQERRPPQSFKCPWDPCVAP